MTKQKNHIRTKIRNAIEWLDFKNHKFELWMMPFWFLAGLLLSWLTK